VQAGVCSSPSCSAATLPLFARLRLHTHVLHTPHTPPYPLLHWQDKLKQKWDASSWPRSYPKNIPRQTNGNDCGVFTLLYANRLGLGAAWDFSQADLLVNGRVRVTCELLEGRLRDMGPAAAAAAAGAAGEGQQ
jgi:hypothetical protein